MKTSNSISTGFRELDQLFGGGFPRPSLTIIGSRPAMGKTSVSIQMATNIALNANIPVAIFSLEMSKGQLTQRILTQESEIDASKFNTYNLMTDDFLTLAKTMDIIEKSPIYIDDTVGSTIVDIRRESRILKKSEDSLGLIVIDYLQLIEDIKSEKYNRFYQLKVILRGLRNLSKELNIPIIVNSQLSRRVEAREDKHPVLLDLHEIKYIEEYADIVAFIYREDYYKQQEKTHSGITEITVAQNKMGSCGTVKLHFNENIAKFRNLESDV